MNQSNEQNAQIHAQLGRKYEAGFVTDIESDSLPPGLSEDCLLYTSPSPRDRTRSRMPSSA